MTEPQPVLHSGRGMRNLFRCLEVLRSRAAAAMQIGGNGCIGSGGPQTAQQQTWHTSHKLGLDQQRVSSAFPSLSTLYSYVHEQQFYFIQTEISSATHQWDEQTLFNETKSKRSKFGFPPFSLIRTLTKLTCLFVVEIHY